MPDTITSLREELPYPPPMAMRPTLSPITQRHVVNLAARDRFAVRHDQRPTHLPLQPAATPSRPKTKIRKAPTVHAEARRAPQRPRRRQSMTLMTSWSIIDVHARDTSTMC
jgi:hypothetical protein